MRADLRALEETAKGLATFAEGKAGASWVRCAIAELRYWREREAADWIACQPCERPGPHNAWIDKDGRMCCGAGVLCQPCAKREEGFGK